jgi:chorismate mutase
MTKLRLRAIRGAVCVERDEPELIYEATRTLLTEIVQRNAVPLDAIISVIFTVTPDLVSAFPAMAARSMGWLDVPLLCTMEIPVPGALGKCIRVLVHAESERSRTQIRHVYLGEAQTLRPDQPLTRGGVEDTSPPPPCLTPEPE